MSIKFYSINCPNCGAALDVEEDRKQLFCSYCGSKIMTQNENEYIYRRIDEAEIQHVEADKIIRLKELELEEKENQKAREGAYLAYAIAGGLAIIGAIIQLVMKDSYIGLGFLVVAAYIAMLTYSKNEKKRTPKPDEVQIDETLTGYRYKGQKFNTVVSLYETAGFNNIVTVPLHDLTFLSKNKNGKVEKVTINGSSNFYQGQIFLKSAKVIITYHSIS